ncbi:helix-turn-helix domain-containing protein [Herbaspirillum sp. GCM10030257]|uniref:AraC family transcriptional regulator n=1 Tax=Herbaspirillum sp. GCM10030257 TaxID=3273393 RepID=UPI003621600A
MKAAEKYFNSSRSHAVPAPSILFRSPLDPANAACLRARQAQGELVYRSNGVMKITVAGNHYLAPPQHAIWLPPAVQRSELNTEETGHCSLYVAEELCDRLPQSPCAVALSPLLRAMLEHLRNRVPGALFSEENERFLQVLVDQLAGATFMGSYLPTSDDPILGRVLQALIHQPGDTRSLAELARDANTTERTLMRRCQRELGMPFAEWRQRLRVITAMPLLEAGLTVENVALNLGYRSASAFIVMFRRVLGMTPMHFIERKARPD